MRCSNILKNKNTSHCTSCVHKHTQTLHTQAYTQTFMISDKMLLSDNIFFLILSNRPECHAKLSYQSMYMILCCSTEFLVNRLLTKKCIQFHPNEVIFNIEKNKNYE